MSTAIQDDITNAVIDEIAAQFYVGGTAWTVKRADSSGVLQTVATASPLYVLQEQPSALALALAQSAATLRTVWKAYGRAAAFQTGDTLICVADTSLSFLVTGLDLFELPGAVVATLEKQPFV